MTYLVFYNEKTLPVCLLQGDRGYEGPKGSRGPPGVGFKGDKVQWILKNGC